MPKSRRSRGEGSFHALPDGRIKHSISLGFDAEGRRLRPTVYGATKLECRELMAIKLEEIRKLGGVPVSNELTVGGWLTQWLVRKRMEPVAAKTYELYESTIRLHIASKAIGQKRLDRLGIRDVDAWLSALAEAEVGGRTRQYARMILVNALNDAIRLELLDRNVAALVRAPRHRSATFPVWNIQQSLAFLEAAETDRFHALWVVWVTTGARPHELLGLRSEDFDGSAITIMRQLRRGGQDRVATKTPAARRTQQLAPVAIEALRVHRARLLSEGLRASPWLFPGASGKAMSYRNLIVRHYEGIVATADQQRRRALAVRTLQEKNETDVRRNAGVPLEGKLSGEQLDAVAKNEKIVGLPRIRPYDLRHTYATLALTAGVPIKVVSESLGHTNIELTLRTYAHVLQGMRDEHVDRIQSLFGKTDKAAS